MGPSPKSGPGVTTLCSSLRHRNLSDTSVTSTVTLLANNFLRSRDRRHFVGQVTRRSIQFSESRKDTCRCVTSQFVNISHIYSDYNTYKLARQHGCHWPCRIRCRHCTLCIHSTLEYMYTESDWRCFRGCAITSSHGRSQNFSRGGRANSGMMQKKLTTF